MEESGEESEGRGVGTKEWGSWGEVEGRGGEGERSGKGEEWGLGWSVMGAEGGLAYAESMGRECDDEKQRGIRAMQVCW